MSKNLTKLLLTIITAVGTIWIGPTVDAATPLATKITQSLIVVLGLAFSAARLSQVRHMVLGASTLIGFVTTLIASAALKLPHGSALAVALPVALAVVTNLQEAFAQQEAKLASVVMIVFGAIGFTAGACHNITPDSFYNAVVDCAKINPEASSALSQVETCLVSAVSGNPAACLTGLVTEAHFTVDEVACVTAYLAQQQNAKAAKLTATASDLAERQAAVNWLTQEHIQIRNSYSQ